MEKVFSVYLLYKEKYIIIIYLFLYLQLFKIIIIYRRLKILSKIIVNSYLKQYDLYIKVLYINSII